MQENVLESKIGTLVVQLSILDGQDQPGDGRRGKNVEKVPDRSKSVVELDIQTVGVFLYNGKIVGYWVRFNSDSNYEYFYLSKRLDANHDKWDYGLAKGPLTLVRGTGVDLSSVENFEESIGFSTDAYDKRRHTLPT